MMRMLVLVALVVGCKARHATDVEAPPAVLQPDDDAFPTERAAIGYGLVGGFSGRGEGFAEVWADGTVRFSRGKCVGAKKSTLPVVRVAVLLDALDRSGIFESKAKPTERIVDGYYTRLWVAAHGKSIMVMDDETPHDEYVREAGRLIDQVLGPNPCR
jgi:hypothetical protein